MYNSSIPTHEKITGTSTADKERYYIDRAFDIQNGIVTYKSASTRTSEALIWTYRTTSCDVISIITTTVPIKDGHMKDINLENRTIRRLKPPSTKKAKALSGITGGSPFEFGLSVDRVAAHKKIHKMLLSEKNDFMAKLNVSRFIRSKVENTAAVKIQARYRGHTVRLNYSEIVENAQVNANVRSNLKSYLANNYGMIVSYSKFRRRHGKVRQRSAIIIQCAFLRYLSRLGLHRRRRERWLQLRHAAAVTIQRCARGTSSRARVRLIMERNRMMLALRSAIMIQTAVRAMFGRRRISMRRIKLRMVASAMIIHWYKSQFSRKMAAQFKAVLVSNRRKKGALAMQLAVRRFLAKRRVNRLRLRRLYKRIFRCSTVIQCCIRRFLACARVRSVRVEVTKRRKREAESARLKLLVDKEAEEHAEMQALLEGADLFAQAKAGKNRAVEDIFTGLVSTDDHFPTDTDDDGDTLLTIAAARNNLDLVRKCLLQWGFDIHHRNKNNESALVLAIRNQHNDVLQYLINHAEKLERVEVEVDLASGSVVSRPPTAPTTVTTAGGGAAGEGEAPAGEASATANDAGNSGDSTSASALSRPVMDEDGASAIGETSLVGGVSGMGSLEGSVAATGASTGERPQSASTRPSLFSQDETSNLLSAACSSGAEEGDVTVLKQLLGLGLDVNARSATSGCTAVHAACAAGHLEAFKLLVKNKANLDAEDDSGQRCLHKAAKVSLKICELILGLDPNFSSVYMSDLMRSMTILRTDGDGKDSILMAILGGQTEVVECLEEQLKAQANASSKKVSAKVKSDGGGGLADGEIGWTPGDVADAIKLVEKGNLICIKRLMELGFDPNWQDEGTGTTMASHACALGEIDVIDLLLTMSADFSIADERGRTPLHLAVQCEGAPSTLGHILTHSCAAKCNITPATALCTVDLDGNNVFHLAAVLGQDLNIDLLARSAVDAGALKAINKAGYTPLMLCCRHQRDKLITKYISMGAEPSQQDQQGHDALWHLYHPDASVLVNRRPFCSEWFSHICTSGSGKGSGGSTATVSKQLNADIAFVSSLLKHGCRLFSEGHRSDPTQLLAVPYHPEEPPVLAVSDADKEKNQGVQLIVEEVGDVLVAEGCITLLRSLISTLSPVECWKLFVSSIRFNDGNSKVLLALLRGGIIERLMGDDSHGEIVNENAEHLFALMDDLMLNDSPRMAPKALDKKGSTLALSKQASTVNAAVDSFQVVKLQQVHYLGMSVPAWCVRLRSTQALQMLVRKGFDVTSHVDTAGNPLLHFIALHGQDAEHVNIATTDKRCRVEQLNAKGLPPSAVAAKAANFVIAQRLFSFKADARRGLEGKYWAWILAVARRRERNEMNLQTGRIGDDDETYFNVGPDPFYLSWM